MKKNKGEITTQQIVMLIILLVSFAIILFLLFRLDIGGETEKELCHNSVVTRGSSVVPSDAVPLKCSRTYLCITKEGSCVGLTNPEVKKVKTKEEVYQVLADEMADCWWMMGEGKVDYVGEDFFFKENYCSICSQILFDDSLNEIEGFEGGEIDKDEFFNYLTQTKYSEDKTYSQYLFGTNSLGLLKQELSKNQSTEVTFGTINIGENQYYLVTGITSEVTGRVWKYAVAGISGVAGIFVPGAGWTWAGAIVGALVVGVGEYGSLQNPEVAAIPVGGSGIDNVFMAPTIQEAESEKFKTLNCQDILF